MSDPRDMLDTDAETVPDPLPFPKGKYRGEVVEYEFEDSRFDKTKKQLRVSSRFTEPEEISDQQEYDAAAAITELSGFTYNYYFDVSSPKGKARFAKFMQSCGLTGNMKDNLPSLPGTTVIGEIDKKFNEKREEWYNPGTLTEIKGIAE